MSKQKDNTIPEAVFILRMPVLAINGSMPEQTALPRALECPSGSKTPNAPVFGISRVLYGVYILPEYQAAIMGTRGKKLRLS